MDLTTTVLTQMGVIEEKTYTPAQAGRKIADLERENAELREKLQIAQSTLSEIAAQCQTMLEAE